MATSRRAWPSPIGEEMYSARLGRHAARVQRRRRRRADEIAQQQVQPDRVTGVRDVAGALERHELAAGGLRQCLALRERPDLVAVAVNHQGRAPYPRAHRAEILAAWHADPAGRVRQRLRRRLECPADAVFDLLGRMRLVDALGEEELEEPEVVPCPVVAVVLRPTLVGVERLVERVRVALGVARGQPNRRTDVNDPVDTLGMVGGEDRPPQCRAGHAHERCPLGAGRVQDRERIGGELVGAVRLGAGRPVRAAVASPVERDDPEVPGEVRDLHLPGTRVDDRPGRQQQHRRLAVAVPLPEDPHPVALGISLGVGISGASLLAPAGARELAPARGCRYGRFCGVGQTLVSNTRLNGVSAARRKRVKPPASTTSRIRASPACAPSARPTSCESDAGVHSSVENP